MQPSSNTREWLRISSVRCTNEIAALAADDMEMKETEKVILEIRQKCVSRMNGAVSEGMRSRGIVYRLNYGVSLPDLKEIAAGYQPDETLASDLWRQDCRECRMLAAMLYPSSLFLPDLADEWIETIEYPDLAEVCCKFLFRNMPGASEAAFRWMASDSEIRQYCGFLTLAHLLRGKNEIGDRYAAELRDQAEAAAASDSQLLREGAAVLMGVYGQCYGRG